MGLVVDTNSPPPYQIRIAGMEQESITDGPGLRMTVFVQGCPHHCMGCHNPQTHSYTGGYKQTIWRLFSLYLNNPLLQGITFSGGEPFTQPRPLIELAQLVHGAGGDVVTYTGYTLETLQKSPYIDNKYIAALLEATDMLIDGKFELPNRSLELQYRGSTNQHIWKKQGGVFVRAG